MIDYSFKKLKKEQNKLLDKTFFNLQNVKSLRILIHFYSQLSLTLQECINSTSNKYYLKTQKRYAKLLRVRV